MPSRLPKILFAHKSAFWYGQHAFCNLTEGPGMLLLFRHGNCPRKEAGYFTYLVTKIHLAHVIEVRLNAHAINVVNLTLRNKRCGLIFTVRMSCRVRFLCSNCAGILARRMQCHNSIDGTQSLRLTCNRMRLMLSRPKTAYILTPAIRTSHASQL